MGDTHHRSLVKTITWRIIGSTSAATIAYIVTGSVTVSGTIGAVHLVVNTLLYWVHERAWARITWGRENP
jgi:uncharacterized membrane protein